MENFRISSLEINEIGPFGSLKLNFPEKPPGFSDRAEIHILTGENGTGKTTVLEMLAVGATKNPVPERLRKNNDNTSVGLSFSKGSLSWSSTKGPLQTWNPGGSSLDTYWKLLAEKSLSGYPLAFFAYSGYRRIEQVNINGIQELTGHPFEDALDFQRSVNPQQILQWIANTISKEAIELRQINSLKANRFREAIDRLKEVIGRVIEQPVDFDLETDPLNVIIKINGEDLSFNQLPDGLKSIISWIADLLMRMDRVKWVDDTPVFERNFILFLDEIEVHLHPAWQRKILPAVQKLFPNAQIFISTHSPFVVGSVDGARIHKFVKPNGDSQLAGPPILSEDAHSLRYWLAEIFDIEKEFGGESQKDLDTKYHLGTCSI